MTANPGGKGHMDRKSLFEKVQTMLAEQEISTVSDKVSPPTSEQWISAWREFNQTINDLMKEDPRRQRIDNLLPLCDSAFERGDLPQFQRVFEDVRRLVNPCD